MIALEKHPEGTILAVRAQPGAGRNEIRRDSGGVLKACVTQAPEKGRANKAVIGLLAKALGLRKAQIELIAGETSRQKRLLIRGVTPDELAQRIEQALKT